MGPECGHHCGIKDGQEAHCSCRECPHLVMVEVTQMGDTARRYVDGDTEVAVAWARWLAARYPAVSGAGEGTLSR